MIALLMSRVFQSLTQGDSKINFNFVYNNRPLLLYCICHKLIMYHTNQ